MKIIFGLKIISEQTRPKISDIKKSAESRTLNKFGVRYFDAQNLFIRKNNQAKDSQLEILKLKIILF